MEKFTGIFSKKKEDPPIPLPPIDPLEDHADINAPDVWEAVERFPTCLLLTDPILPDESRDYKVKEIVFNVKGNDQGWSNEDNFEGDYEGSWTWFEVAILRPVEAGVRISPRDKKSTASEPCIKKFLDEKKILEKLQLVTENDGPFWHLQRNRRGNGEAKGHEVVWNPERPESESERLGWDFDAKTGEGSGVGFMKSINKGDRVAIIARAKQSGSVNYILEAKIKINFEGFEPTSDPPAAGPTQNPTKSLQSAPVGDPRNSGSISDTNAGKLNEGRLSPLPALPATSDAPPRSSKELTTLGATSYGTSEVQGNDETQPAIVEGNGPDTSTVDASTKGALPILTITTPTTDPSDSNVGPPVPEKSPKKSSRWRFSTGGKKKQDKNTKADPTADNGAQAQSGATTDTPMPIVEGDEPARPAIGKSSTASTESNITSPLSATSEQPKSPTFWGLGNKVSWKAIRPKTFDKKGGGDKAEDSGAEGS